MNCFRLVEFKDNIHYYSYSLLWNFLLQEFNFSSLFLTGVVVIVNPRGSTNLFSISIVSFSPTYLWCPGLITPHKNLQPGHT